MGRSKRPQAEVQTAAEREEQAHARRDKEAAELSLLDKRVRESIHHYGA